MQLILVFMVISSGCSHKVVDSAEDLSPDHFNSSTLLHPVDRVTTSNRTDDRDSSASSWKIASSLADSDHKADNLTRTTSKETQADHSTSAEETTKSKPENVSSSEFRASPQLGSFHDEDNLVLPAPTPTRQTYDPFSAVIRRPPPPGFFSPYEEERWLQFNKIPKETLKQHWNPFRTPLLTPVKPHEQWNPSSVQVSRPTAETPIASLPAGTLYHSSGSYKHTPSEFGMDFHGDLREIAFKKPPVPPWSRWVRALAALVPLGVIVSALTPGVLHVQTTDNNVKPNANNIYRRADHLPTAPSAGSGHTDLLGLSLPAAGDYSPLEAEVPAAGDYSALGAEVPALSEHCRRRLLCELQHHHKRRWSARRCRMHCEDPDAMHAALQLLRPPQPHPHPQSRPVHHVHHNYSYA